MGQSNISRTRRAVRRAAMTIIASAVALVVTGCGPFAPDHPTAPMSDAELTGTWTSAHDGTVTFNPDGTFTFTGIPYRGYVDDPGAGTTPMDDSGTWSWFDIGELSGNGWKELCLHYESKNSEECIWQVRGSRTNRELDLVVGDPDSVDWYRYKKTAAGL